MNNTPPQYDGTEESWAALEEYGRTHSPAWFTAHSAAKATVMDEVKYFRLLVSLFYAQSEGLKARAIMGIQPSFTYRDEGKRKFQLQPGD